MLRSINLSHAALAFTLSVPLGHPICLALTASHQVQASDADIKVLVDDLSTARRGTAKARLLKIGLKAAPQLIAGLRDLTEFVEEPLIGDVTRKDWDPQNDPAVSRHKTAQDAMYDCIELLGLMKSEDAVPAIIKALEIRMPSGREPKRGLQEIRALEEIGSPAVPALIDALARAPETAGNQKSIYAPGERLIQIRMALTLADIGDPRAIPALEDLGKTEPAFSRGLWADAIARMRLKQQPQ